MYGHLYYSHYDKVSDLGESDFLNVSFRHFILFVLEFRLVDVGELRPLQRLISEFASDLMFNEPRSA